MSDETFKIGEALIKEGKLTESQLKEALKIQDDIGREKLKQGNFNYERKKIGEILVEKQFITPRALAETISKQYGLPLFTKEDLENFDVDIEVVNLLKEKVAKEIECIVLKKLPGGKYFTISTDPSDLRRKLKLKSSYQCDFNSFEYNIVARDDFDAIYNKLYKFDMSIQALTNELKKDEKKQQKASQVITPEESSRIANLIDSLLAQAISERASDIHIEPTEDDVTVRFRIDTILVMKQPFPKSLEPMLLTKFINMANVDSDKKFVPRDGRFEKIVRDKKYDFRINFMPQVLADGEVTSKIAIRILNRDKLSADITEIGFTPRTLSEYRELIDEPSGLVIVVGPMGSGKTTTLYSTIRLKDPLKKAINTLEDPPEFIIPHVTHSKIDVKQKFTYGEGLKSILRQDSDIVLVGEIRDEEVAQLSFNVAAIGRLVLSTLHVDNAISTVMRLTSLGVSTYLISSFLNGVVSQRLVRRICPKCMASYNPHPREIELMEKVLGKSVAGVDFKKGKGCPHCNNTGYYGLTAVYEILNFKKSIELRDIIHKNQDLATLSELAYESGFKPMIYDVFEKIIMGYTTFEEAFRVVIDTNQRNYRYHEVN